MSFLVKSVDDLAAGCMSLEAICSDLYDLAALACSVGVMLQRIEALSDEQDLAIINVQRLACLVANGVERAAVAMGHLQPDVSEAPLTALRVASGGKAVMQ